MPRSPHADARTAIDLSVRGARTFGYLGGAAGLSVVLVYLAVNIAVIRAFRTEFREEFSSGDT
jgi:hypothetical protein